MKNTELEKLTYPAYTLRRWTHATIHCYLQNCICKNCIYQKAIKHTQCRGKQAVLILVEKFGIPKNEDIRTYYEIEKELKRNGYH